MKNIRIILVALLTLAAVPVSAQTYLTTTTLSAAVTSTSQNYVTVAATTTAEVGGAIFVDHEVMTITAISGLRVNVVRGAQGTNATTHNNAAVVIIAPKAALTGAFPGGVFTQLSRSGLAGSCTASNYAYLPIVDVSTGNVWLCWAQGSSGPNASRLWHATNTASINGVYSLLVNLQ